MILQRRLLQQSAFAVALVSMVVASTARAVTIDMVTVGNPGNADNVVSEFVSAGGVGYSYQIGKYDVTIQQYTDFLNAAAKSDPYSLYDSNMASDLNIAGISQSGSDGAYTYSVIGSSGNKPITYVSWFDAARFSNWMQNGQGSGDTETGAYTLNGQTSGAPPSKNAGATFYIPTQNEWYKAAFYDPTLNSGAGGYWQYTTRSNTTPGNVVGSGTNQANFKNEFAGDAYSVTQSTAYDPNQNYLTNVGAFTNNATYYGTFDQGGNVRQWTDLNGGNAFFMLIMGGDWNNGSGFLKSDWSGGTPPGFISDNQIGFRLGAPVAVPEPSTCAMALAGLGFTGYTMFRRRKRA